MNIEARHILSLNHYKKGKAYTGSFQGMRYRIRKFAEDENSQTQFCLELWQEPFNYESTPKDKILSKYFTFDEEGYNNMLMYLNEAWEKKEYII